MDIYDPNISKEDWIKFITEVEAPNHPSLMKMLVGMMALGGQASCKQLADEFGGNSSSYVGCTINLGQRAMKFFNKPGCKDGDKVFCGAVVIFTFAFIFGAIKGVLIG